MENIKGKILGKSISEGETADGDAWTRASFEIEGHKYSSFDQKVIDDFNPGDCVDVGFEKSKDGKYNNIKTIKKLSKEDAGELVTADEIPSQGIWEKKDKRMARMNALRTSAEILHTLGIIDSEKAKEVFKEDPMLVVKNMADQLVAYIYEE